MAAVVAVRAALIGPKPFEVSCCCHPRLSLETSEGQGEAFHLEVVPPSIDFPASVCLMRQTCAWHPRHPPIRMKIAVPTRPIVASSFLDNVIKERMFPPGRGTLGGCSANPLRVVFLVSKFSRTSTKYQTRLGSRSASFRPKETNDFFMLYSMTIQTSAVP